MPVCSALSSTHDGTDLIYIIGDDGVGLQEALGEMPFDKLLWARYSAFLPLYPLGVASELTMVYLALPTIHRDRPWSISMPNALNFSFDYYWLCIILSVIYIPGQLNILVTQF